MRRSYLVAAGFVALLAAVASSIGHDPSPAAAAEIQQVILQQSALVLAAAVACGWLVAQSRVRHPYLWAMLLYYAVTRAVSVALVILVAPSPAYLMRMLASALTFALILPPGVHITNLALWLLAPVVLVAGIALGVAWGLRGLRSRPAAPAGDGVATPTQGRT